MTHRCGSPTNRRRCPGSGLAAPPRTAPPSPNRMSLGPLVRAVVGTFHYGVPMMTNNTKPPPEGCALSPDCKPFHHGRAAVRLTGACARNGPHLLIQAGPGCFVPGGGRAQSARTQRERDCASMNHTLQTGRPSRRPRFFVRPELARPGRSGAAMTTQTRADTQASTRPSDRRIDYPFDAAPKQAREFLEQGTDQPDRLCGPDRAAQVPEGVPRLVLDDQIQDRRGPRHLHQDRPAVLPGALRCRLDPDERGSSRPRSRRTQEPDRIPDSLPVR